MKTYDVMNMNPIKRWGRIIGIGLILYGVISIIYSFFTSFAFIIPAIISIFIGKLLYDIGHEANRVVQSGEDSLSMIQVLLHKYLRFLVTVGIVIGVTIVSYITFFIYAYM